MLLSEWVALVVMIAVTLIFLAVAGFLLLWWRCFGNTKGPWQ